MISTRKRFPVFAFLALIMLNSGCNSSDCITNNEVFKSFNPGSREYKIELNKHLINVVSENLSYWVSNYFERDGQTFLQINIQGDSLCAKGEMLVTNWNKLQNIKAKKGVGYRGAQLVGLKFQILNDSLGNHLVFQDVDVVVD